MQAPPNDKGSPNQKAAEPLVLSNPDGDSSDEFPASVLPQVTQRKENGEQEMSTNNVIML